MGAFQRVAHRQTVGAGPDTQAWETEPHGILDAHSERRAARRFQADPGRFARAHRRVQVAQ